MPALRKGEKKIMAKRIRSSRFDFNLPEKQYTTQALENYVHMATRDDMLALRAEYTRMRDTAQKRIKRIQEAGFGFSKYIQERPEGFPKLKDIDERDLPQAMNELYRFLSAKTSTLAGQRETMRKTIETFEKSGVTITPKEYPRFITDENIVNAEDEYYDEDLEEGEEADQIYTGDIFKDFEGK